ncbi:MAG: phosphohydrolase [Bacteroidota bacterium]
MPPSHIQTFTGRHINPFDPDPAAIDIEDIAHALSHICRFTGHTRTFYSVAEHCTRAADYNTMTSIHGTMGKRSRRLALATLLHDASEAYLTDIPRPLKPHVYVRPYLEMATGTRGNLYSYRGAEGELQTTIYSRFGLTTDDISDFTQAIHEADLIMLATERRDLLTPTSAIWPELEHLTPMLPDRIVPLAPAAAKTDFLRLFHELTQEPRP